MSSVKMSSVKAIVSILCMLLCCLTHAKADDMVQVTASIKPIHSIAQAIIGDVGEVLVLVSDQQSPHGFYMEPSDVRRVNHSDVVFYINNDFESFIKKARLAAPNTVTFDALSLAPNISMLSSSHSGGRDFHIWLDIDNVIAMAHQIAATLSKVYPGYEAIFQANKVLFIDRLKQLDQSIAERIAGHPQSFVMLHNAYRYFVKRYRLNQLESVKQYEHDALSVNVMKTIKDHMAQKKTKCLMYEIKHNKSLIEVLKEGNNVRTILIDPIGYQIEPGAGMLEKLLRRIADAMQLCFERTT